MGSLNPGYNAAEGMVTSALQSLAQSISRELAPQGIPFVHVRMGTFNLSAGAIQHERQVQNAVRADILTWPENLRFTLLPAIPSSLGVDDPRAQDGLVDSDPAPHYL